MVTWRKNKYFPYITENYYAVDYGCSEGNLLNNTEKNEN